MSRKRNKCSIIWLKHTALAFTFLCLPHITFCKAEAIIYHSSLASVKQLAVPYKPQYNRGYVSLDEDDHFKQKDVKYFNKLKTEKVFQIEPSDAIDIAKYSQPALDHQTNPSSGVKVPSISIFKARLSPVPTQSKPSISQEQVPTSGDVPKRNTSKPMRDLRFIESSDEKSSLGGEYKFREEKTQDHQSDMSYDEESYMRSHDKNNFTDTEANLLPVSSDAVLSYKVPSVNDDIVKDASSVKISTAKIPDVPSHQSENPISTHLGIISSSMSSTLPEFSTETAIIFNTHHFPILNHTDPFDNTDGTVTIPSIHDIANFSSSVPMLDTGEEKLSPGIVAGIVIAVLVSVTILSSAVIYLLYKKYNGKCTSVVEGKFNSDNCGYLDDSLRSSIYLNNHIELPKESSEEMSSLDNDSFLNSLETMTIQNYWVDNSKNTKV